MFWTTLGFPILGKYHILQSTDKFRGEGVISMGTWRPMELRYKGNK